ncbi:MAG: hypothetical protein WDM89_11885 [Rhizomicrobium sp.]
MPKAPLPNRASPLVGPLHKPRQILMPFRQQIDAEGSAFAEDGVRRCRPVDAKEHRWRIHTDGTNRGRGHGVPLPALSRGDQDHRLCEAAHRTLQLLFYVMAHRNVRLYDRILHRSKDSATV